jgi:aerobic-type carbon monoxide dehydrogenase small subunit (CoxS/CutS family)
MGTKYNLHVNGRTYTVEGEVDTVLLSVLREQLDLTGTKYGCGEGQCGACTVLIDGQARRSCTTPISTIAPGKPIVTIEGLADGERLHAVQQAFLDEGAMQCAYCTSGMILSAVSLLNKTPNPSDTEILAGMQGNICRCGTYPRIVAAIRRASAAGVRP